MKSKIAITAMAGVFPGTDGRVTIDGFWENIKLAKPASVRSLQSKWGLKREQYFDPRPGTPYRTYLDVAYTLADQGASIQAELGKQVIHDLFHSVSGTELPDPRRIGLCLATLWSDNGYFAEDARRVLGRGLQVSAGSDRAAVGPDGQLAAIAAAAGISGPALAVDTACASSLYALDAAIGLIEQRRADAVAVMGLNGFLPPFLYLGFSKLTALSPKGQILPFSSEASGIIPSEAIGAILVEPLEQAVRSGRTVLAVIRTLGLSADGGDCSVFAPSAGGQQLAYERAYRAIDPGSIDYVEAHGTATVLGDATEIESLDRFFAPYRHGGKALPIGSVKALIGHSLSSAGISSLIKGICMIRDGVIPPHIRVEPNARLRDSCLRLPLEAEPWPEANSTRRVAISSFGLGGSNSHLVIGALEEGDLAPASVERSRTQIAIMALDATMAEAHGSTKVREVLKNGELRKSPFPWRRFSSELARENQGRVTGRFFPPQLSVEAAGLRMGPKALAKLDPFQRLGIHAIQRTLASLSKEGKSSQPSLENMGVVFCSNLGGEAGLQLSRHYLAHFSGKGASDERYAKVEPSYEAIATSLASLCSGFAAFHLGMKGFHETISGDTSSFWQTLMLTPYWLDSQCSSLVLAAGRHIKSPIDLDHGNDPGEGVASFLLQSEQEAERRGQKPLAVIRAMIPCTDADENALERACAAQGIDRSAVGLCEISQLHEAGDAGFAQKVTGFLGEATGVEALLHVLLASGTGWRAIEIRDGRKRVAHLLIEKLREWEPREETPAMPLPVEFQTPEPKVATPKQSGMSIETFLAWQRSTQSALSEYFRSQAKLYALAEMQPKPAVPDPAGRPLRLLRRDEKNIVLEPPVFETSETGTFNAAARLKVDEGHSYFFDHPLDHVPGILIMEGVLQLVELLKPEDHFIRSIDLNFRRFCEKHEPILVRAEQRLEKDRICYSVGVLQNGSEASHCEVETAQAPAARGTEGAVGEKGSDPSRDNDGVQNDYSRCHRGSDPFSPTAPSVPRAAGKRIPDPRYVHKRNPENVLITEIEEIVAGQICGCQLLPPPAGHILSEGAPQSHSLLYVMEAMRQFVMLAAHSMEKIPLGMPMNLVAIRVRLDEPAPRGQSLRFVCSRQPVQRIGQMTIADIGIELHAPHGKIGWSAIKAQVVDRETYSRQRALSTRALGRK